MTYIGEEFQKRFKTLPQDIQEALTAVATVDTIFAMGKKHGLMVDKIGKTADEIWKVMLGLANPKDFIRNLASVLGIDSAKASAIASDINAQIFQPIQESLRRLYDSSISPAARAGSQPPAQGVQEKKLEAAEPKAPQMIYPQDRFEEEFKKESIEVPEMFDTKGRTREASASPASSRRVEAGPKLERGEPEQLAPLVPAVVPPDVETLAGKSATPRDDFTYPEKTKDVHREPAIGNYKGRDPYRESTEE